MEWGCLFRNPGTDAPDSASPTGPEQRRYGMDGERQQHAANAVDAAASARPITAATSASTNSNTSAVLMGAHNSCNTTAAPSYAPLPQLLWGQAPAPLWNPHPTLSSVAEVLVRHHLVRAVHLPELAK